MSRGALQTEVRNIAEYSDFCERAYGYLSIAGRRTVDGLMYPEHDHRTFWRLLALNSSDFFSHLAIRRQQPHDQPKLPGRLRQNVAADNFQGLSGRSICVETHRRQKGIQPFAPCGYSVFLVVRAYPKCSTCGCVMFYQESGANTGSRATYLSIYHSLLSPTLGSQGGVAN